MKQYIINETLFTACAFVTTFQYKYNKLYRTSNVNDFKILFNLIMRYICLFTAN